MHIALCGPVTIDLLKTELGVPPDLPGRCHPHPFTAYLAQQYLKMGHSVSIVTTCPDLVETKKWQGPGKLQLIAIPRRKTLPQMLDLYRTEVHNMRNVLRDIKPDVIHAQWTYEYADAALATKRPVLVTARDAPWRVAWLTRSALRLERTLYCQLAILPRVRHLSTVSPYMAGKLKQQYFYRRNIHVVPNGIFLDEIAAAPKQKLHDINAPIICCISEWGRLKNLISALRGFQILRKKIPNAQLILFGVGLGSGEVVDNYCRQNGLDNGVKFMGYQPQSILRQFLRQEVDIMLHTSREESFGMTILDGMTQGIPCVGGKAAGAVPWLLDGGKCGILLNVMNPQEIAEGLLSLIEDTQSYHDYALAAHDRVLKMFTIEKVAEKYIKILETVSNKV
jgi:glycosyltransferase involved in cell wall biosynthesis